MSQKIVLLHGKNRELKALEDKLVVQNFKVIAYYDGFDALNFLNTNNTDLLIISAQLPDMDGYQFSCLVKSADRTAHLPVIVFNNTHNQEFKFRPIACRSGMCIELNSSEQVLEQVQETLLHIDSPNLKSPYKTLNTAYSSIDVPASMTNLLDELLIERIIAYSVRSLFEAIEPRRKFIEHYFRTISKLFDCSVYGILISHGSSPWGAIKLSEKFDKDDFKTWLSLITRQSYIEQDLNLELRGELATDSKMMPSAEVLPVQGEHGLLGSLIFAANSGGFDDVSHIAMRQLQQQMHPVMQLLLIRQDMELLCARNQTSGSTDSLTGLYNFEFLIGFLQQQLLHSFRQRIPLGLLLIELDGLHKLNNEAGWEVGNLVLNNISTWLLSHTRASDLVTRYGGNSFAIVLPNTDLKGARILGEKIQSGIANKSFATSVLRSVSGISARIGCAVSKGEDLNPESILHDAREGLQTDKHKVIKLS